MLLILVQGSRAELAFEGPPFVYLHGKYNKSQENPSRKHVVWKIPIRYGSLGERSYTNEVGGFSARNGFPCRR